MAIHTVNAEHLWYYEFRNLKYTCRDMEGSVRLKIQNLAKIEYADIKMNGITVIAGKNNTGKSTIGKVVFALFNSLSDIEGRLLRQKENLVYKQLRYVAEENAGEDVEAGFYTIPSPSVLRSYARELCEHEDEQEQKEIIRRLLKRISDLNPQALDDTVLRIYGDVSEIMRIPAEKLMKTVVSAYFSRIFHENICNVHKKEACAEIKALIKGKVTALAFSGTACKEIRQEIKILNRAFYLDNPFVLNRLNSGQPCDEMEKVLLHSLRQEADAVERAVQYNITSSRLENVLKYLNSVAGGRVYADESREYLFQEQGTDQPLSISNLSAGLKSFVIIKMLLENHSLRERDVLILDEPEIHLHPEWQMKYAEIIVLLQKEFDLTIILTTHSSHFLEALRLYAHKYGIKEKCNYYMTTQSSCGCVLEDMTEDVTQIYAQLIDPSIILNQMRYETEEAEDD